MVVTFFRRLGSVLRIWDVYPVSRILNFSTRIPDRQHNKKEEGQKLVVLPFFVAIHFTKIENSLFEQGVQKKLLISCQKIRVGSEIRDPDSKNSQKNLDSYCFVTSLWLFIFEPNSSVADPDPPDPHVFGPPRSGSGSTSQRYRSGSCSGSGSFYHRANIVRKTLIPTILWLFLTFYLWKMM